MISTDLLKNERAGIERRLAVLRIETAQAEGAMKFLDHLLDRSVTADAAAEAVKANPVPLPPRPRVRKKA